MSYKSLLIVALVVGVVLWLFYRRTLTEAWAASES